MKKIVLIVMSFLLVISFAACTGRNTENADENSDSSKASQVDENSGDSESPSSETVTEAAYGKTLVVYYSATGNTGKAAEYIAKATGGDLFELVPVNPYSDADLNWTDENSRVVKEHDNPEKREVALVDSSVENFDEYDTVFIGYPIWWAIAAWPVDGFVKANDFTGKTVVPFCTSASSGLGESGKLLEKTAGSGNWLEGKRFPSAVSETEIEEWVESLGMKDNL